MNDPRLVRITARAKEFNSIVRGSQWVQIWCEKWYVNNVTISYLNSFKQLCSYFVGMSSHKVDIINQLLPPNPKIVLVFRPSHNFVAANASCQRASLMNKNKKDTWNTCSPI